MQFAFIKGQIKLFYHLIHRVPFLNEHDGKRSRNGRRQVNLFIWRTKVPHASHMYSIASIRIFASMDEPNATVCAWSRVIQEEKHCLDLHLKCIIASFILDSCRYGCCLSKGGVINILSAFPFPNNRFFEKFESQMNGQWCYFYWKPLRYVWNYTLAHLDRKLSRKQKVCAQHAYKSVCISHIVPHFALFFSFVSVARIASRLYNGPNTNYIFF